MVFLLIVLSHAGHWMVLMFISSLLVMYRFMVSVIFIKKKSLLLLCFGGIFQVWFFLVGWLILHFLIEFLIMPFIAGLFYSVTPNRYFVYMSIVYFVYYESVQKIILYFGFFKNIVSLELCLGCLLVFGILSFYFVFFIFVSFEFLSYVLIVSMNLLYVHGPLCTEVLFEEILCKDLQQRIQLQQL